LHKGLGFWAGRHGSDRTAAEEAVIGPVTGVRKELLGRPHLSAARRQLCALFRAREVSGPWAGFWPGPDSVPAAFLFFCSFPFFLFCFLFSFLNFSKYFQTKT
jgi:hypothetical protein